MTVLSTRSADFTMKRGFFTNQAMASWYQYGGMYQEGKYEWG